MHDRKKKTKMKDFPNSNFSVFNTNRDGVITNNLGNYSGCADDIAINLIDVCDHALLFFIDGSLKISIGKKRILDLIRNAPDDVYSSLEIIS